MVSAGAFPQTLPLDPAVRTGKLGNGFTYYIRHNEDPKHRVLLYLVSKAGSILEDEDQRGLAHFIEHMGFNGTKHFPHNQLVDYLQRSGVRFGADVNAYTSFDETVYELPVSSDKPELLKGGIRIIRDWAQEASLEPAAIDKERGVVLEEKRMGKGAAERIQRQTWPVMFNQSRYAERIPIGLDTVIENFKRPAIARFYRDWYRPDLQALIVVGDINVDAMEQTVRACFSTLKNPPHERPRPTYQVPLTGRNQFIAVTDKEMTGTVINVLIKHRAPGLRTYAGYRAAITCRLFNQMLGERYAELSRLADPPFIGGGAEISGLPGGLDSYGVSVTAKPGELERGFKAAWRETVRVKRFGFTRDELDRAKGAYLAAMGEAVKEKDKTNSSSYVDEYLRLFLKGEASPGIIKEYALTRAAMPTITLADLDALCKTYIRNTDRDVLIMAPENEQAHLPQQAEVSGWFREVEGETLNRYHDGAGSKPLLSAEPVPGRIISRQYDSGTGVITYILGNGLKVVLKPTNFQNDEILFNGSAPGGSSLYSDADYQSAAFAAKLISANGAGNYAADELGKFLSGKQLSVAPYITERFEGFNGAATKEDMETCLQLLYAYFTEPRKDSIRFRGIMERSKDALLSRSNNPKAVFNDTVSAVLGNYNVRKTGPSVEKLGQISLDRSFAIYRERFADAGNFTFTFAGNIDTSQIKPLLEKYLGSLPSTGSRERARELDSYPPAGYIVKTVHKGSEPQASVLLVFSGPFNYSPEHNIELDALKEVLEIRLLERLREEESGVYSPAVSASSSKYPQQRFIFSIQFGCAPENVEKLIASTLDEVSKLHTAGPLRENVSKWLAEENTSTETELKTNKFWLAYLSSQLQNNEPLDEINREADLRGQVGPEVLRQLAAKYLKGDNLIRLVLLPEEMQGSK